MAPPVNGQVSEKNYWLYSNDSSWLPENKNRCKYTFTTSNITMIYCLQMCRWKVGRGISRILPRPHLLRYKIIFDTDTRSVCGFGWGCFENRWKKIMTQLWQDTKEVSYCKQRTQKFHYRMAEFKIFYKKREIIWIIRTCMGVFGSSMFKST